MEFDNTTGLHSLAVKLGKKKSFHLAKGFHLIFFFLLLAFGLSAGLGFWYWIGWLLSGIFLFWQHWNLKDDLENLQASFFTANGLLSIFFLGFFLLDIYF
jgi:4-hydroxybenzoate polyprenyltransferase